MHHYTCEEAQSCPGSYSHSSFAVATIAYQVHSTVHLQAQGRRSCCGIAYSQRCGTCGNMLPHVHCCAEDLLLVLMYHRRSTEGCTQCNMLWWCGGSAHVECTYVLSTNHLSMQKCTVHASMWSSARRYQVL